MNVWRQLIENNSPVDLQTTLHTHGFSFLLDKTVFTDSKIDRTCYVQSFARLIGVRRNAESVLVDFNAPNSINYFVVSTDNTQNPAVSNSTSVITSQKNSEPYCKQYTTTNDFYYLQHFTNCNLCNLGRLVDFHFEY